MRRNFQALTNGLFSARYKPWIHRAVPFSDALNLKMDGTFLRLTDTISGIICCAKKWGFLGGIFTESVVYTTLEKLNREEQ